MKKLGIMFLMTFLIFGVVGFVAAEENVTSSDLEIQDAGAINGFDRAFDNLGLALTTNPEKKAERALLIAEERLAEIEKLTEEEDLEGAEKLQKHYDKMIEKSGEAIEKIEAKGNEADSEEAIRKMARIQNSLQAHEERLQEVHTRILENSEGLTEEEIALIDGIFEKLSERKDLIAEKTLEKEQNFETQHKILSEMTDEEIKALLDQIDDEEGISDDEERRLERDKERSMREVEARKENLERMKEKIKNSNMTEEEKAKALERFEMQMKDFEEFKKKKELHFEELKDLQERHREGLKDEFEDEFEDELEVEDEFEDEVEVENEVEVEDLEAEMEDEDNSADNESVQEEDRSGSNSGSN